jgi:hypothetical protein
VISSERASTQSVLMWALLTGALGRVNEANMLVALPLRTAVYVGTEEFLLNSSVDLACTAGVSKPQSRPERVPPHLACGAAD